MTEDEMVGWHHRLNGHGFEYVMNSALETRNDTVLLAPTVHQKLTASLSSSQPG